MPSPTLASSRWRRPGTGSAPFLADAVLADGPHRDDARSLSRRLARLHGPDTGSRGPLFRQRHVAFRPRSGQVRGLGDHRTETRCGSPGCADHRRGGRPGLRRHGVAGAVRSVPAKTPPDIVRKISADTNTALADPAIKDKLAKSGYVAEGSSPQQLEKLLTSEIAKWSAVIKSVGIKID